MAEPQIPNVPRPKTPILTGVPDIVDDDDEDEDPAVVPRRLYFADSMQVININMVFSPSDLIPEYPQRSFRPDMVHQVFGDDGIIYGYRNLNIDIYFLANSAKCFVDLQYTEVTNSDMPNHSEPDNILNKLTPWLPENYYLVKSDFVAQLYKENHNRMFGTAIDSVELYNVKETASYRYTFTVCTNEDRKFREFHSRFQCLIVWYIDGASQIDVDDPNWMFIYVYETRKQGTECATSGMYPVGFATVYKFFHYPDKIRTRISQFFIIPPCQGIGVGTRLLKNTYRVIRHLPNVVDITVEEPCQSFTHMRDFLDCKLLMQLESFKQTAIHNGYTNAMFVEANNHYKINKRQIRRVYEILRLAYIKCNTCDPNYQHLSSEIRERLSIPYMRQLRSLGRMSCDKNLEHSVKSMVTLESTIAKYIKEVTNAALSLNAKFALS
ncbi:hypothetical protein PPYR_06288 [Photinus pyralis]|nr:histone acetyltransferase type B catalytic subunit-like isoform X2 [Photinus pyralis]KAB0800548.1 hypothetical protein PPYR_06288 [Photinus pyralis]